METKEIMLRYPRLCAHLISESLGYLTPERAAEMVKAKKERRGYFCELTTDMEAKGVPEPTRSFVKQAIQRRAHHNGPMADIKSAKVLVSQPKESRLASWF